MPHVPAVQETLKFPGGKRWSAIGTEADWGALVGKVGTKIPDSGLCGRVAATLEDNRPSRQPVSYDKERFTRSGEVISRHRLERPCWVIIVPVLLFLLVREQCLAGCTCPYNVGDVGRHAWPEDCLLGSTFGGLCSTVAVVQAL